MFVMRQLRDMYDCLIVTTALGYGFLFNEQVINFTAQCKFLWFSILKHSFVLVFLQIAKHVTRD